MTKEIPFGFVSHSSSSSTENMWRRTLFCGWILYLLVFCLSSTFARKNRAKKIIIIIFIICLKRFATIHFFVCEMYVDFSAWILVSGSILCQMCLCMRVWCENDLQIWWQKTQHVNGKLNAKFNETQLHRPQFGNYGSEFWDWCDCRNGWPSFS